MRFFRLVIEVSKSPLLPVRVGTFLNEVWSEFWTEGFVKDEKQEGKSKKRTNQRSKTKFKVESFFRLVVLIVPNVEMSK